MIVEEGPEQMLSTQQTKPYYLITLSAKHPDALAQKVEDLKTFLDSRLRGNDGGVGDGVGGLIEVISYTLNTGRSHFNYRLALVVSSLEDLKDKLAEARTQNKVKNIFRGAVEQEPEDSAIYKKILKNSLGELKEQIQNALLYKETLEALANLYIKGYELDWELVHQGEAYQRISLPTYPFLKERYWIPGSALSPQKLYSTEVEDCGTGLEFEVGQREELDAQPALTLQTYISTWQRKEIGTVQTKWPQGEPLLEIDFQLGLGAEEERIQFLKIHCASSAPPNKFIIWFPELRGSEIEVAEQMELGLQSLFNWLRTHFAAQSRQACRWILAYKDNPLTISWHSVLAGFAKSVRQEQAFYESRVVGFSEFIDEAERHTLLAVESHLDSSETEVFYSERGREVCVYEPCSESHKRNEPVRIKQKGVYLITGGLGGIGYFVACDIAKRYQCKLILTGRSALDDCKRLQIAHLEKLGADVLYLAGDVSHQSDVEDWMSIIKVRFNRLEGIFHCAGIVNHHLLEHKSWEAFKAVLAPKVWGAIYLDKATQGEKLDVMVLFSSTSVALGAMGATDYASANGFLDSFARWRNGEVGLGKRWVERFQLIGRYGLKGGCRRAMNMKCKRKN